MTPPPIFAPAMFFNLREVYPFYEFDIATNQVKYRKTKDPKQLEDAYQTLRETVKPKPYPNLESFKTIFKDVSDRIPAAKTANAKEFVDTSFLDELDKSGYIDGLYR